MGKKKPLGDNPLSQDQFVDAVEIRDMIRGRHIRKTDAAPVDDDMESVDTAVKPTGKVTPLEKPVKPEGILRKTLSFLSRKLKNAG